MANRRTTRFDEARAPRESADPRGRDPRGRDPRDFRDPGADPSDTRAPRGRDPRDVGDNRADPNDARGARVRDPRDVGDTRSDPSDTRGPRGRDPRDIGDSRADPRDTGESREMREASEVISPREAGHVLATRDAIPQEWRDGRDGRDIIAPRDGRDRFRETRADLRGEPRMDRLLARGDPRGDPRADPRGDLRGDPRDIREYRGEPLMDPRDTRFGIRRDPRDLYAADEMDIDPHPPGRLISYFLPANGIRREVIMADICRYLGADATCMAARNAEGVHGFNIRAYRMLTSEMIEDLKADSSRWDEEVRRWDEEVRRNRVRGVRPAYGDTAMHERPQVTNPNQNAPVYTTGRTSDYDEYGRAGPPPPRTLFPSSMTPEYQNYPVTSSALSPTSMTATPGYVLGRGQAEGYSSQIPRSEYESYPPTAGRGATLQPPNQGQFAAQQGSQGSGSYQDPRTGQIVYPSATTGRGFDPSGRYADGRRR